MGRPKKNFYSEDLGLSIRDKMRQLDLEDRRHKWSRKEADGFASFITRIEESAFPDPIHKSHTGYFGDRYAMNSGTAYSEGMAPDQESDDWLERLYER
jgi:hypothetical protein